MDRCWSTLHAESGSWAWSKEDHHSDYRWTPLPLALKLTQTSDLDGQSLENCRRDHYWSIEVSSWRRLRTCDESHKIHSRRPSIRESERMLTCSMTD